MIKLHYLQCKGESFSWLKRFRCYNRPNILFRRRSGDLFEGIVRESWSQGLGYRLLNRNCIPLQRIFPYTVGTLAHEHISINPLISFFYVY